MEKVLNQEEIDAMVRAARGRAVTPTDAPKIRPWNCKAAGQIGRDTLRAITQLHEGFARNLTHSLGAYLRVLLDVNLVSVEQLAFGEILARMPEITYLATIPLQPLGALAALQLDLSLAFPMIDLLLGGKGQPETEQRDITDIEEQVLEGVVQIICRELGTAWQPIDLAPEFGQRQQPTQMQRLMPPSDRALSLSFEVRIPDLQGTLNLVLPSSASNLLLRKLAHEWVYSRPRSLAESCPKLVLSLLECDFDAELALAPQQLAASSLVNVAPDGRIALKQSVEEPLELTVSGHGCFHAAAVRRGARRAAQIRGRVVTT